MSFKDQLEATAQEGQNDYFFDPTNIFLKHFDNFEIEQLQS